ncbi:MAG TPA: NAD(P)H-hydrate dehydratase [Nitrosopumilaceae archaeon]|nr:NAD(P)H-hydrate dehydratase [Nitrosopumilaceae archaeon]
MVAKNLQANLVKKFIPERKIKSRKGENGIVLVVGGSYIYHGAPIISSLAALRSGADLVYTSVPKINVQSTRAISPNLIVLPLVDSKLTRGAANKLLGQIPHGLDSATIGMGLAIKDIESLQSLLKPLLASDVRLSLDASALVSGILPILSNQNVVVTPHAGEFKRLFGESPPNSIKERVLMVEKFAKSNSLIILLKGPTDIISDGQKTFLNPKKTPAMTVGGTGDVLSGIVASFLARNRNALESASAAAFVNGLAGKIVQRTMGLHMAATDLIDILPSVIKPFDRIR